MAQAYSLPVMPVHIRLRLWARVPNAAARLCMPILKDFPNVSRAVPARTHKGDRNKLGPCALYVVLVRSALVTETVMRVWRATSHRRAPTCAKSAERITCTVPRARVIACRVVLVSTRAATTKTHDPRA